MDAEQGRVGGIMGSNSWVDFPTEAGWWWSRKDGHEREMCRIVIRETSGDDIVVALYPERKCYLCLDTVKPKTVWQKVMNYEGK